MFAHSFGSEIPPRTARPLLCWVMKPSNKCVSMRAAFCAASRTRKLRMNVQHQARQSRAAWQNRASVTRLRLICASCTLKFTATVVAPTPPFAPITAMQLLGPGGGNRCRCPARIAAALRAEVDDLRPACAEIRGLHIASPASTARNPAPAAPNTPRFESRATAGEGTRRLRIAGLDLPETNPEARLPAMRRISAG